MSSSSNSGLQGVSRGALKASSLPHGISVTCPFFAHDVRLSDYKNANKIKTLDVHPSLPWLVTADEMGNVVVWDSSSESIVVSFPAEAVKDSQRSAVEALELHDKFATSQGVLSVPDVAGPGLGVGPGSPPGATVGGGNESYIASAVETVSNSNQPTVQRWKIPDSDQKSARTGNVRGVRFADEHVLSWFCGDGKGDYDSVDVLGNMSNYNPGSVMPLAGSIDEVDALLSSAVDSHSFNYSLSNRAHTSSLAGFSGSSRNQGSGGPHNLRAPHNWIILVCEHRVILLDYITRASIDIPQSSLLVEASGPSGAHRTITKGKPSVHSASVIGAGIIAFGCEDGAIRIWSADLGAVIQVVRPHLANNTSGKPITHLITVNTCPHAGAGSTPSYLSPLSSLGLAARSAQTLLVCGSADGAINVYEAMGGRMLLDNGKGGLQFLKLSGDLVDLSVSCITLSALALTADKMAVSWDLLSGAAPKLASSKIVTSSAAAEGGVGSRLMSGASLGPHPSFPPGCALVVGKGPHLELAMPGSAENAATSGTILFDLRTARPGLPSKLKVYNLCAHPWRPDTFAAATNIGVFMVQIQPAGITPAVVTHPAWDIPGIVTGEASIEGNRVREGKIAVYVNCAGALVASKICVGTAASDEDEANGLGPAGTPATVHSSKAGGGRHSSSQGAAGLDVSTEEHVLLPQLAPSLPPPNTIGASLPGGPPPAHNAIAVLALLLRGASAMLPGPRGVRLRVSGSGRYISAVWPEYRCYAIYKLALPLGEAKWGCEYVDSGPGLDVAWAGATVTENDDRLSGADSLESKKQLYDRFVVIEPGQTLSGRGPMGGGMAIGSSVPAKGSKSNSSNSDAASLATASNRPQFGPSSLSLRQLPILEDPFEEVAKAQVVVPELYLSSEPIAVWGGPILAIALASGTGAATANVASALTSSSLHFFSWTVTMPESNASNSSTTTTERAYSGATKSKNDLPRLATISTSATGIAPPSLFGAASGCGVKWNAEATRFCICTATNVHIIGLLSPRRLISSATTGSKSGEIAPPVGALIELCRIPVVASEANWNGATLLVTTVAAIDPTGASRVLAVFPPAFDPHLASSSGSDAVSMSGGIMVRDGQRLQPVVVEIQNQIIPASFSSNLSAEALPSAHRGLACVNGCVPLGILRSHVVLAHYSGTRVLPAPFHGQPTTAGLTFTAVSIAHPGFRACMAAALAGAWSDSRSSSVNFLQANVWASQWGSLLPAASHSALAAHLSSMGCSMAALLLPNINTSTGLGIALSKRSDVFDSHAFPRTFSAMEAKVAVNFLKRIESKEEVQEVLAFLDVSSL